MGQSARPGRELFVKEPTEELFGIDRRGVADESHVVVFASNVRKVIGGHILSDHNQLQKDIGLQTRRPLIEFATVIGFAVGDEGNVGIGGLGGGLG